MKEYYAKVSNRNDNNVENSSDYSMDRDFNNRDNRDKRDNRQNEYRVRDSRDNRDNRDSGDRDNGVRLHNYNFSNFSVDTRWGSPLYTKGFESEIYNLDGQQLNPLSHRGAVINRETDKQFYKRVENNFSSIYRMGSSPNNYHWQVKQTDGTIRTYGNTSGSTLKTLPGNIAKWNIIEEMLKR